MKITPPQLVAAMGDLDPASFVSVLMSAANRLRKKDRIKVLELLMQRQLDAAKNSKSFDEILVEAYEATDDDNPPSGGEKES